MRRSREAAAAGRNTPQARWRRAIDFASRIQDGNTMLMENGVQDRAPSKFLETQHWLELVDGKHRYGSNRKLHLDDDAPAWLFIARFSGTTDVGSRRTRRRIFSSGLTRGQESRCRLTNARGSSWRRSG
ncbi:hypothetical protein B0H11DRAFT_1094760 [Mycena galericulata]|nr:hypothetical protein B0H11DRAFT_1094760 [Mycena galericulata]